MGAQQSVPEWALPLIEPTFVYLGALVGGWTVTQVYKLAFRDITGRRARSSITVTMRATLSAVMGWGACFLLQYPERMQVLMAAVLFCTAPTAWVVLVNGVLARYLPNVAKALRGDRRKVRVPPPEKERREPEREDTTVWQKTQTLFRD